MNPLSLLTQEFLWTAIFNTIIFLLVAGLIAAIGTLIARVLRGPREKWKTLKNILDELDDTKWRTFKDILNEWGGVKRDLSQIKEAIKDLPKIKEAIKDLPKIKEAIKDLPKIKESIEKISVKLSDSDLTGRSPLALTEKGSATAEAVDADTIADQHLGKVSIKEGANAYEIQEACFLFAENELIKHLDEKQIDTLQTEAFERGKKLEQILKIIGVVIRDKKLSERGFELKYADDNKPLKAS